MTTDLLYRNAAGILIDLCALEKMAEGKFADLIRDAKEAAEKLTNAIDRQMMEDGL